MKIDLKEYLSYRDRTREAKRIPGPIITISREYGCEGKSFAEALAKTLTKVAQIHGDKSKPYPWKFISKEVLQQTAKELHLHTHKVEKMLKPHEKSILDDFAATFAHEPSNESQIYEAIKDVILSYAHRGRVVILGRAGVAVARGIKKSLHIRLQAPLNWRVKKISEEKDLSLREAEKEVNENDKQRKLFIEKMRKAPYEEGLFDITFNRETMTPEEMVSAVIDIAELKHMT